VHEGVLFFSNFGDQRLYRLEPGGAPVALTPAPITPAAFRYADPVVTPDGRFVVCVRERHLDAGVENDIVAVPSDGSAEPAVLASGHDFFAAPRVSPDGSRLAWLAWDHPRMPWDGTTLFETPLKDERLTGEPRVVTGGPEESVTQPRYDAAGRLHYVSDRTGWWNLYRDDGGTGEPLAPADAEFSGPDWVFGQSTYTFLGDGTIVAVWTEAGSERLGLLRPGVGRFEPVDVRFTEFSGVVPFRDGILAVAGSPTEAPAVAAVSLPDAEPAVLRRSRDAAVGSAYLSLPQPVEFPTTGHRAAHALFYPPTNPDFEAPPGELPPLLVLSHGGPTSATSAVLNYRIQFWTSRGFGVVDVNYGGSTGYGRAYRERLKGQWGVVDVDDCVHAARWLADQGRVDGARMVIRGGSAGGYTTMCALTFTDVFAAGASHYGVADLGALARDTHKFEARYLDGLVGPWPEAEALYEERSPIFHTDRLRTPLIIFQGLEDRVVPPEQAEMLAAALRDKGVPFAYIAYEGEQHGFRRAENIKRTTEAELAFYGAVLGFTPADAIAPIRIEHADARG
jgi:dipeptidyl aminopeptidase/acylaminoacyl peptidase